MLTRAAVYGLPVTLEGLAAVAGASEAVVRQAAEQWRAAALVHVDRSRGRDLWLVYGMLRSWLLAPERLEREALRVAQQAAGDFLGGAGEKGPPWTRIGGELGDVPVGGASAISSGRRAG